MRYHPAVIAQAAATVQLISEGRFHLGLGAGERLNEHVVARGWPAVDVRHEMLAESVEIIRALWSGGNRTYRGKHLQLEDARLYTLPDRVPDIVIAAGGPQAAELAARIGDGAMVVEPKADLVKKFTSGGGSGRPVYGQLAVCWAADEANARKTAHDRWRFALSGWKVQAELPNAANFEAESAKAREEDVAEMVTCGNDPQRFLEALQKWTDAGVTHVGVVQAGDDQEGYLRFWQEELQPRLRSAADG